MWIVSWVFALLAFIGVIVTLTAALVGAGLIAVIAGVITLACGLGMFATAA